MVPATFPDEALTDGGVDVMLDLQRLAAALVVIGLCDLLCKAVGWFPEAKSNTRYFTLHVLVNGFVTYIHFKDVVASYANPSSAGFGPCDTRGSVAIYALHIYHILFYRPLPLIDWVHHGVMVIVMLPLAYCLIPGHLLGHGAFYASGFPGGVDYLMLVLVKRGWMKSIDEKRYNENIQLWIRAPGCLAQSMLTWVNYVESFKRVAEGKLVYRPMLPGWMVGPAVWVVILTFFWNGMFFLQRVIDSHTRHEIRLQSAEGGANGKHADKDD